MPRPDPAWLDRQYNNRARVPDHAAIFERGARASALAREESRCHLDLPYGSGPNETLDVFRSPASDANASVLVFVHGGWRIGRLNPLH
jgi:arylformamidase